ncbi:MAG: hypothetical protein JXQ96_20265 [Cyclobacteriaceae bacterium]
MKNALILSTAVLSVIIMLASCGSQVTEPSTPEVFKFDSLVSESYEIYFLTNPSTTITAYTTGSDLSYHWSTTAGDIFGSGKQVTYTSNPACCGGYQTISCIVISKDNSGLKKEVEIYVDF